MTGDAAAASTLAQPSPEEGRAYTRTIWALALGISAFATVQVGWAWAVGSRQFLKDGTDWIFDVVLYGVAAVTFGRGARAERISALGVAGILAVAGLQTLWDLWDKIVTPRPIDTELLGFSAASAILIGYAAAGLLLRFRHSHNPLIQATWLSARNDAITTTLYAALTFAVRAAPVRWPEYALDVFGALLSFQAAGAIVLETLRDRRGT